MYLGLPLRQIATMPYRTSSEALLIRTDATERLGGKVTYRCDRTSDLEAYTKQVTQRTGRLDQPRQALRLLNQ
jgi:hypothetical protein